MFVSASFQRVIQVNGLPRPSHNNRRTNWVAGMSNIIRSLWHMFLSALEFRNSFRNIEEESPTATHSPHVYKYLMLR